MSAFFSDICSLLTIVCAIISIIFLLRVFGVSGLFVYSVVVVIASNIQVLKVTKYSFFDDPVPLGTVLFSSMFAVDNIVTELFGQKTAKKMVYMTFASYLVFSVFMILSDWHPSFVDTSCVNYPDEIHKLFSPSFVFFVSSICAYVVGQLCDIHIYSWVKKKFLSKKVFVFSSISMVASTFIDNFVFSILAWKILSDFNISWSDFFSVYILNTSVFRILIVVVFVPLVHFSKMFAKTKAN